MSQPTLKAVASPLTWQEISQHKRLDREAILQQYPQSRLKSVIPPERRHVSEVVLDELSPSELEIVRYDATAIVAAVKERRFTCLEVIQAHCHAAVVAQDLMNCLTEIFFEEALQRAKELDDHMERTGSTYGPLHGLPVSVKDHIMIKGKDTSTGYVAWCYKTVAEKDAVAVDILRKAGAILFVKTNNPQTLLSLETDNNIFGRTSNPFDRDRTAGGSSGGESALISCYGSPLGLGTDIGGSIVGRRLSFPSVFGPDETAKRLPAACTGLYGFKASVARIPHQGLRGSHDGMDAIIGVLGPIARSARDLSLFCKVMLQFEPWLVEPPLLEMPWREEVAEGFSLPSKLCFAILWDDGVFSPDTPIMSALNTCRSALTAKGHNVVDWEPMGHKEAWELLIKLYFLDGGQEYWDILKESGEPPVPQTEWILAQTPNKGKPFTVAEIFRLNLQREGFRQRLIGHWNNTEDRTGTGRPVDAIITPVAPTLAPKHGETKWWGYTSYWNLADYPAAVFPVDSSRGSGVMGRRNKEIQDTLLDNGVGLPVCLQVIGRRLNEEKVLAMLNVIDRALVQDLAAVR